MSQTLVAAFAPAVEDLSLVRPAAQQSAKIAPGWPARRAGVFL